MSGQRLAAALAFIAAALALVAAVVNYTRQAEIKWSLLAATAFLVALGLAALRRSRSGGA
jgi:hypothetical protein